MPRPSAPLRALARRCAPPLAHRGCHTPCAARVRPKRHTAPDAAPCACAPHKMLLLQALARPAAKQRMRQHAMAIWSASYVPPPPPHAAQHATHATRATRSTAHQSRRALARGACLRTPPPPALARCRAPCRVWRACVVPAWGKAGGVMLAPAQRSAGAAAHEKVVVCGESVWFFVFLRGRPLCSAVARGGRPSGGRGRAVAGGRSGGRVSGTVWHGPRGRRCVERPSREPRDLPSAGRVCLCSSCPRARSSCSLCRPLPRLGGAKVQVRAGRARSVGGRPIIGGSEARRSLRLLWFARARACAAPS